MSSTLSSNKRKREDQLYKLLRKDFKHFNFQYAIGENILPPTESFNTMECMSGGLYTCYLEDIPNWMDLYSDLTTVCEVTIPPEASFIEFKNKIKASKIILSNPTPISEFIETHNLGVPIITANPEYIKFIKNPSDMLQLLAVSRKSTTVRYLENPSKEAIITCLKDNKNNISEIKNLTEDHIRLIEKCIPDFKFADYKYNINLTQDAYISLLPSDGCLLNYITNQTPELCKIAVQQTGCAIKYVDNQTPELCQLAVKTIGAIKHIEKKTYAICLEAVKHHGLSLDYIPQEHITYEICIEAVNQNGLALQYVPPNYITPELCTVAVKRDGLALMYIDKEHQISSDICLVAITQNIAAYESIKRDLDSKLIKYIVLKNGEFFNKLKPEEQTPELCLAAVRNNASNLHFIENQSDELCKVAIDTGLPNALYYIKNQTPELCKYAITLDVDACNYIKDLSRELYLYAVNQNINAAKYYIKVLEYENKMKTNCTC